MSARALYLEMKALGVELREDAELLVDNFHAHWEWAIEVIDKYTRESS